MSPFESHRNSAVVEAAIPAAGAAVAQDQALARSPIAGKVSEVALIPEAALTANGSAYRTFRLLNKGQDGTGTTVVASRASDTVGTDNQVAFDEWTVDLSATASNLNVAAGDVLVADEQVTGGGVAHSGYRMLVQIVK